MVKEFLSVGMTIGDVNKQMYRRNVARSNTSMLGEQDTAVKIKPSSMNVATSPTPAAVTRNKNDFHDQDNSLMESPEVIK